MPGLEREMAVYREKLGDLLTDAGKYVVIKGEEILPGGFDDYESALEAGYERFGPSPFLVKQIAPAEPILYFTRDLP
jgi:hypothetical protein